MTDRTDRQIRADIRARKQLRRIMRRDGIPPAFCRAVTWIRFNVQVGEPRYNKEFVEKVRNSIKGARD